MAKKKKKIHVSTISGLEILKQTRGPQDIPFRTGVQKDKKKESKRKAGKVNKNRLDKWL